MTDEQKTPEPRLTSWKEIASHLGVAVRTAQYWEKEKGLPVRRVSQSPRSRVSASVAELDAWQAAMETAPSPPDRFKEFRTRMFLAAAGVAVVLTAAILLLVSWAATPGPPFRGIVQGESLVMLDRAGRICWTYEYEGLSDAAYQPLDPEGGIPTSDLEILDIDSDGSDEFLFRAQTEDVRNRGTELICLDSDGTERWRFMPGRPLELAGRKFNGVYNIDEWMPIQIGATPYLLVNSRHFVFFPAQLALVDARTGDLAAEYWHPGEVTALRLHDLDRDGADELLVGGRNNPGEGIGHPFFAVLELPFASRPEAGADRNYFGAANAKESAYALFRNVPIYALDGGWASVTIIEILRDRGLRLTIDPHNKPGGFLYTLDQDLQLLDARPTDDLIRSYLSRARQQNPGARIDSQVPADWERMLVFTTAPDGNRKEIWDLFESDDAWTGERQFGE